jgi:RND family efflux transporter MFP subunit
MTYRSIVQGASLIAALVCTGCDVDLRPGSGRPEGPPIPVHVEIAVAERSTPTLHLPAVVEPASSRLLAFRYAGRIARVRVADGQRVAAGDIVAEFDLAELERRVEVARVAVERAQRRVAREATRSGRREQLFELASVPAQSYAPTRIESLVREAEARYARVGLAAAEAQLAAGVLRAPTAGIIDARFRLAGAVASPGEPVVRLSEIRTVALRAAVPRDVSALVREGGRAEVRLGERSLAGSIRLGGGRGEPVNDGVPFEVQVENADFVLQPGDVVELAVEVAEREVTSSISLAALQRGVDERPFGFVVAGEGVGLHVERRRITVGGLRGDRVLVLAGVAPGERVVSLGYELLTVGDRVTIVGEGR